MSDAGELQSFKPQAARAGEKLFFVLNNKKKFGKGQQNKYVTNEEIRCCQVG